MGSSLRTTAYLVAAFAALGAAEASGRAATTTATIARLDCAADCAANAAFRPGSLLRARGRGLSGVDQLVFLGLPGEADDVAAEPAARRRTSVDVRVPLGAAPGPIAVVDGDGVWSAPSAAAAAVQPASARPGPSVELAVRSSRFVYDAGQPATLTYLVHAPAPADVAIDLVRMPDGVVIAHWEAPQVVPEMLQAVTWDGVVGGKVQRTGRYVFRAAVASGGAAQTPASGPDPAAFEFARDRFPILGPRTFGNGFGGGRGHQGQDIFAACGTPLVAAHGGVVRFAGFHGRAGNYVVIDNEGTGSEYAYMHLSDTPLVAAGARVRTGQPIGFVGATGAASACQLHFEIWSAPGWYAGGRPVDPAPALRAWGG